jgi:hypothetical protein
MSTTAPRSALKRLTTLPPGFELALSTCAHYADNSDCVCSCSESEVLVDGWDERKEEP